MNNAASISTRSDLKIRILVQGQGGPDTEMGRKDNFETASTDNISENPLQIINGCNRRIPPLQALSTIPLDPA
jgi:hypothetical protein